MGSDDGQTIGLYVIAVAALLFLAFAFFAVGQAGALRNGAQGAADAAVLAAATEARDGVEDDFLEALQEGDLDALADFLAGNKFDDDGAQEAAVSYAAANGADVIGFQSMEDSRSYRVEVESRKSVGDSVVDGTESKHAKTEAVAVIESLCEVGEKDGDSIKFSCNDGELNVDLTDDEFELRLARFFSVHLSN